jgi:hypothetical protein
MRTLPREVAESIYYDSYIVAPGLEPLIAIDAPVTEELYDTASTWERRVRRVGSNSRSTNSAERGSPSTAMLDRVVAAYAACQARLGAARLCVGTLNSLDSKQRRIRTSCSRQSEASRLPSRLDREPRRQRRSAQVFGRAIT